MSHSTSALGRFMQKWVQQGDCWVWEAGTCKNRGIRYSSFWTGERNVRGHKFSYEAFVGPVPDGLTLDHLCRNPLCVNPAHLEAVTNEENIARMHNARKAS